MKIKDRIEFKNKGPVMTFAADEKVIVAIHEMSKKNYGASVVIDQDNKPVGIVTERDFMRRLLDKGLDPNTTPIRDIMTSELKLAHEDDSVVEWLQIMSNERFRHLPVVDAEGRLINLMSQGDFVSYTWPQLIIRAKDAAVKTFVEAFRYHLMALVMVAYAIVMFFIFRSHQ